MNPHALSTNEFEPLFENEEFYDWKLVVFEIAWDLILVLGFLASLNATPSISVP